MDCKDAKEYLGALIDGEVTNSEREEVLSHIAECEACRKDYEELLAIRKNFKKLDVQLRGALTDSVVEKICADAHTVKKKPFFVKHIGTAAALVIIAGLFIYTRLNPIDMAKEEIGVTPDSLFDAGGSGNYNYVFGVKESVTADDESTEYDTESDNAADNYNSDEKSETASITLKEDYSQSTSDFAEAPVEAESDEIAEESITEPSATPEMPKFKDPLKEAPSSYEPSTEAPVFADYRFLNSIELDMAIIFVDSEMETLLSLFNDADYVSTNQINVNDYSSNVMNILISNSIPIISTDIPKEATETAILVE